MHSSPTSLTLALLAAVTMSASAGIATQDILVDFDDQVGGISGVPTDGMFSEYVSFSTDPDHQMLIISGSGVIGGSGPNSLTSVDAADGSNFNGDIYMNFTSAVNNVSLDVLADNDFGTIATISVAHAGGVSFYDVIGNGDFSDAVQFDFSDLSDVTSIELYGIIDEFGLGIDNLAFSVPVPAPGSAALLGMGLLTAARRSR